MIELKSPYEWCLEANMRVLDVNKWPEVFHGSSEKAYYEGEYSKEDFLKCLDKVEVKPNSTPRKTDMYLEYRMYGLVPYNISSIQSGIQFGHAVVEYAQNVRGLGNSENIYNKWANQDKTFIILNGGTTNEDEGSKWYGSLQQHRDLLREYGVLFAEFREPDLNDTLTAIVFLVDERVFNRELYPDYVSIPWDIEVDGESEETIRRWEENNEMHFNKWLEKIGGEKNDFLRGWLKSFKLAN
jgi:hypothetical protein